MSSWRSWRQAMAESLYGEGGFYRRPEGPAGHFRTSPTASPLYAEAILALVGVLDAEMGSPGQLDLVDVGAGRGELLGAVAAAANRTPELAGRLRLTGVEVVDRPAHLDPAIAWVARLDDLAPVHGLLLANEWLDNVPVDVVELAPDGLRLVEVDISGAERLAGAPADEDSSWLKAWWPLSVPGERAEVGRSRDDAWAAAVGRVVRGLAVAVDYGLDADQRPVVARAGGSLTGYRAGRQVAPVPDASMDLTAHVALDSCGAAGVAAGAGAGLLRSQRAVLRALGLRAERPDRALASADPAAYLIALSRAGEAAELADRDGLGGFTWLLQPVGLAIPALVARPLGGCHEAVEGERGVDAAEREQDHED